MIQTVLVINSGSSSIKYQLVDSETGEATARGLVERIGDFLGNIKHAHDDEATTEEPPIPDHEIGMHEVPRLFDTKGPALDEADIVAIGYRIVRGGKYFDGPVLVTDEVRDLTEQLHPMAPLHDPAHFKGIDVVRKLMPGVPHVAVFDTASFQQLPDKIAAYALNAEAAEKYAIRRYGVYGTLHQFVSQEVAKRLGHDDLRQTAMYLGNGASVSAVLNSRSIDTPTGLTPFEGLMMGTRIGDIDPAVVFHLACQGNLSIDEIDYIFNKESGTKGLTGESDMRSVWAFIRDGSEPELQHKVRAAMGIYVNRLLKYVGSHAAELGGLGVMSFTAGIDENDSGVRRELAEALAPFGVKIDVEKNEFRSNEPLMISAPDSKVLSLVLPTNEEPVTARQTLSTI